MIYEERDVIKYDSNVNEIVEKVAFFLNSYEGRILVQLSRDNPGNSETIDQVLSDIIAKIKTEIFPNPLDCLEIYKDTFKEEEIVAIDIKKSRQCEFGLKEYAYDYENDCKDYNSPEYVTIDSDNYPIFTLDIPYSPLVDSESSKQDLTFNELKEFYHEAGKDILHMKEFFIERRFLTTEGKFNKLAEMFSDYSDLSIQVVVFPGEDKLDIREYLPLFNRGLITSYKAMTAYLEYAVNTLMRFRGKVKNPDLRIFDMDVLKEVILNAMFYCDWSGNSTLYVFVYSDRIEVQYPISSMGSLTLEEFQNGPKTPRRLEIIDVFMDLGLVSNKQFGTPLLVEKYGEESINASIRFATIILNYDKLVCLRDFNIPDVGSIYGLPSEREVNNSNYSLTSTKAKKQDLTFYNLAYFYHEVQEDTEDLKEFLKKKRLLTKGGEYNILGEILSDVNNINFKVVYFKNSTRNYPLREVNFNNECLISAYKKLLFFSKCAINTAQRRYGSHGRRELNFYQKTDFREALLNAIFNNDWISNRPIVIHVFTDRLEIQPTINSDNISLEEETSKNYYSKELKSIFKELGLLNAKELDDDIFRKSRELVFNKYQGTFILRFKMID